MGGIEMGTVTSWMGYLPIYPCWFWLLMMVALVGDWRVG